MKRWYMAICNMGIIDTFKCLCGPKFSGYFKLDESEFRLQDQRESIIVSHKKNLVLNFGFRIRKNPFESKIRFSPWRYMVKYVNVQ